MAQSDTHLGQPRYGLGTDPMEGWSMALSSRRSARRSITTAAVGLLALGFVASCGKTSESSAPVAPTTTSQSASAAASVPVQPTTTQSASAIGEVRPGCGTYCQSAGPLQGAPGEGQDAVTIVSGGTVTLDPDGYLPVTLTCNLSVQCRGSVIATGGEYHGDAAGPDQQWTGRSDLLVDAGATATLGLRMPAPLVAYIRAHNPPCAPPTGTSPDCPAPVGVLVDSGPSFGCALTAAVDTGLPNCGLYDVQGFHIVSSTRLSVVAPG
jgi:hypothetical protein